MKINVRPLPVIAALILVASSCSKDDTTSPASDSKLTGRWLATATSLDANENGIVEPSEREVIDSADSDGMTFNADRTGSIWDSKGVEQMKLSWELRNNDKDLVIMLPYSGGTFPWSMRIERLDDKNLILLDADSIHRFYREYRRL